ncbi:MAG: AIR synthase family protein [Bacillota bacterium]
MTRVFDAGKLPLDTLKQVVFRRGGSKRPEVLVYPSIGEDTSVVDVGSELLVISTDPITGAQENAGWLGVKVALNDIGASGAEPICIMVTLLLPEGTIHDDFSAIIDDIHRACVEENVAIAGGHSEVTPGLSKPIISVTAVGKTVGRKVLRASGARPGDDIVMTKWAGMEGTAILAKDFRGVLQERIDLELLDQAEKLMAWVSVTKDGRIALLNGATGSHDATEGGVLGAIYEVCEASGTGARVDVQAIPVLRCTQEISRIAGIDPLRLVASGCLVITAPDGPSLCEAYRQNGINAQVVGKITSGDRCLVVSGELFPLESPKSDELWRARQFFEGMR